MIETSSGRHVGRRQRAGGQWNRQNPCSLAVCISDVAFFSERASFETGYVHLRPQPPLICSVQVFSERAAVLYFEDARSRQVVRL